MNLKDLSNSIELHHVGSEYGWGESIVYQRLYGDDADVTVNAFVKDGNYRYIDEHRDYEKVVFDEKSFLSVELDSKPIQGDKIVYGEATWYVQNWDGDNPYDIACSKDRAHSGSRSGRRTK